MDFKVKYENVAAIFLSVENNIKNDIAISKFPFSLNALYNKVKTMELIRNGVEKTAEPYAVNILYRSMLEHYFVGYYIFLKSRIDSSDEVGIDYYNYYANSERIKQESYEIQLGRIKVNNKLTNVTAEDLKLTNPDLQLSQSELEKSHEVASQFNNIRKIGQYLITNKHFEPHLTEIHELQFEFLKDYNMLSSFVHGGPFSEAESKRFSSDAFHAKHIFQRGTDWTNLLGILIKTFLVLILKEEYPDKYQSAFVRMRAE